MNDIIIMVDKNALAYKKCSFQKIGNEQQNLQNKLKFEFEDEVVEGQAWLEYEIDGVKKFTPMEQYEKGYQIDIKNSLLTGNQVSVDLKITQDENPEGVPVFVTNIINFDVEKTINAEEEEPEQYPNWFEAANKIINEANNLDLDINKNDNVSTITINKKDGTQKNAEIYDGLSATIQIGSVTTLNPGENATVTNVGTENNAILNFGIPKGEPGQDGSGDGGGITTESDPTVPNYVKNITEENINSWNTVGDKVDKVSGKELSSNDFTNDYKLNVDNNTSARHTHSNKTILDDIDSTDITNWNNKVDSVEGKGLSSNDYTTVEKEKLAGLNNYILPQASSSTLGGVKIGTTLEMSEDGILNTKNTVFSENIKKIVVVDYLPEVEEEGVLYLVKNEIIIPDNSNLFSCSNIIVSASGSEYTSPTNRSGITYTFTEGEPTIMFNGTPDSNPIQGFKQSTTLEQGKNYKLYVTNKQGEVTLGTQPYSFKIMLNDDYLGTTEYTKCYVDPVSEDSNPSEGTFTPETTISEWFIRIQQRPSETVLTNYQFDIVVEEITT